MEKAIEIKRRAQRCILNGDLDGALAEYEKLVASGDPDPYYWVLLADLLYKKGNGAEAQRRYLEAIDGYEKAGLYKNGIAVCKKMSRLSLAQLEVAKRLAQLHALDGLAPEAVLAYHQCAELLVKQDRLEEAREALQKAAELSPETGRTLDRLAEVELLAGDPAAAEQAWTEAAERYERAGQASDAKRCRNRIEQLHSGPRPIGAAAPRAGGAPAHVAAAPDAPPAVNAVNDALLGSFMVTPPGLERAGDSASAAGARDEASAETGEPLDVMSSREAREADADAAASGAASAPKLSLAGLDPVEYDMGGPVEEPEGAANEEAPAREDAPPSVEELAPIEPDASDAGPIVYELDAPEEAGPPVLPDSVDEELAVLESTAESAAVPELVAMPPAAFEPEVEDVEAQEEEQPPLASAATAAPGLAPAPGPLATPGPPPAPVAGDAAAPRGPTIGIERFGDDATPPRPGLAPVAGTPGANGAVAPEGEDPGLAEVSMILAEAQMHFHGGDRLAATTALMRAAQAYDHLGRYDSAAAIYRSLGHSPDVSLQLMMLWLKNCQRRDDRQEAARVACDLGDRALNDGDAPGARDWFERARSYDPENDLAARRLHHLESPSPAGGVATAVPPQAPLSLGAATAVGEGYLHVRTDRDEPVMVELGSLIEEFRRAIEPELASDPQGSYDLGVSYREMGLIEEAIDAFRHAGAAPSFRLRAGELAGRCLLDLGRFDEAADALRSALDAPELRPSAAVDLRYQLGLALEAAGRGPEALAEFERVYAAQSSYPDVAMKIRVLRKTSGVA